MSRVLNTAASPPPRSVWESINPVRLIGELSETRYWMYLLLLPSALLITAVVLYPTVYGMQMSFREMRLNRPDLGTDWVLFKHYARMINDPIFWLSLRNTAVWVTSSIVLEFLIGLIAALALNRNLPGTKVLAVLILIPYFLPNVVAGHMWALMLDPRLGVINDVLVRIGVARWLQGLVRRPGDRHGGGNRRRDLAQLPVLHPADHGGSQGHPNRPLQGR